MKRTMHRWIAAIALVIAFACASWAWTTARREKQTQYENQTLRRLLSELQEQDETILADAGFVSESFKTADELVVLQELMEEPAVVSEDTPKETYIERMERMKEDDFSRYTNIIHKGEQQQQKLKYSMAERTALFMDLDTSQMTRKELKDHNMLIDQMTEIWDLMGQMKSPAESNNREVLRELNHRIRKTDLLLKKERNTMLKQL